MFFLYTESVSVLLLSSWKQYLFPPQMFRVGAHIKGNNISQAKFSLLDGLNFTSSDYNKSYKKS